MKIAVPVEGENLKIAQRTGRAPFFAIFEYDGNNFKLVSLNENTHAAEEEHEHGEGHEEKYSEDEVAHHHKHVKASKVDGCDYIVLKAVGPNMKDALKLEGIKIIRVRKNAGEYAPEILENIKGELK